MKNDENGHQYFLIALIVDFFNQQHNASEEILNIEQFLELLEQFV
jgi:hypothetical protein